MSEMTEREKNVLTLQDAWGSAYEAGCTVEQCWLAVRDAAAEMFALKWLPIESAPKDETLILALVEGVVRVVAWGKTSHVPIYGFCLADQGAEDFDICHFTHWMPLPQPPETDK